MARRSGRGQGRRLVRVGQLRRGGLSRSAPLRRPQAQPARHLRRGRPHYCLGAHLAKLEVGSCSTSSAAARRTRADRAAGTNADELHERAQAHAVRVTPEMERPAESGGPRTPSVTASAAASASSPRASRWSRPSTRGPAGMTLNASLRSPRPASRAHLARERVADPLRHHREQALRGQHPPARPARGRARLEPAAPFPRARGAGPRGLPHGGRRDGGASLRSRADRARRRPRARPRRGRVDRARRRRAARLPPRPLRRAGARQHRSGRASYRHRRRSRCT